MQTQSTIETNKPRQSIAGKVREAIALEQQQRTQQIAELEAQLAQCTAAAAACEHQLLANSCKAHEDALLLANREYALTLGKLGAARREAEQRDVYFAARSTEVGQADALARECAAFDGANADDIAELQRIGERVELIRARMYARLDSHKAAYSALQAIATSAGLQVRRIAGLERDRGSVAAMIRRAVRAGLVRAGASIAEHYTTRGDDCLGILPDLPPARATFGNAAA